MSILGKIMGLFNPNEPPASVVPTFYATTTSNTTSLQQQHLMNQQAMQSHYALQQHAMMNAQQPQYGVLGAGGQNMKGIGGYSQASPPSYRIDDDVDKLMRYAELCGDAIQMVILEKDAPCEDVKIIMLKASKEGELVKEVGIKISDTKFAVYREKGEIYV